MSLKPSPPLRLTPACSNRTSWLALIWICLCSRGVKTLAPPLGKDFSSSLKTLFGATLSDFALAGDGSAASSDFRRFADRSLEGAFSFFKGVLPCSAFRFIAPIARSICCTILKRCFAQLLESRTFPLAAAINFRRKKNGSGRTFLRPEEGTKLGTMGLSVT